MSHLLIDDRGELWRGESRQLREAFDSPFSGGEFVEYAVKNLGFVAINIYGRSLQLRLRPGFVTSRALSGLIAWLKNAKFERIVLSRFEQNWRDELLHASQIKLIVDDLLQGAGRQRPDDYLSTPLAAQAFDSQPLIGEICEHWEGLVETYDTATLVALLRSVFNDRYVTVKRQPDSGKLTFHEFGEEMFPTYDLWRTCAVGAPIQEQPDRAYGRWVATVYGAAAQQRIPHLAAVDAVINCPVRGRKRVRYRRMIFPLPAEPTGQLLLGGSFDDGTIDLRVPAR